MRGRFDLRRRVNAIPKRKRFFLFLEGANTEPVYFKAYERRIASATIELVISAAVGAPISILEAASGKLREITKRAYIRQNGDRDQVWLVFDRDEHLKVPDVRAEAERIGLNVAFSDPCFEVWLILHERDYDKDEHRHVTQALCEIVCGGYVAKGRKLPDVHALMSKVEVAEDRAEKLVERREADGGGSPYTDVFRLTQALRSG